MPRISSRSVDTVAPAASGAQRGGQQLVTAWKAAAFDESVERMAKLRIRPQVLEALGVKARSVSRDLSQQEADEVVATVEGQHLAQARKQALASLKGDPKAKTRLFDEAIAELNQRVPGLRNPFAAVAQGDPAARANEAVLWENPQVMVLLDRFVPIPKVLVIPKAPAATPLDLNAATLDELAKVAQAASQAFTKVAQARPSDRWVNPPQVVTLAQVHVHVVPNLPPLAPNEAVAFWQRFSTELASTLNK